MSVLEASRVEKTVAGRTVLSVEALRLDPGDILAVVGPMGSGKSLLVRLLCGEITPNGGSMLLDGEDIRHHAAARRRIGTMFEEDMLYERLSLQSNLELYRRLRGYPNDEVRRVMAAAKLEDQAHKRAGDLPATIQRRVAFARALLGKPSVLLLDQPALRTDLDTQALFRDLIIKAAAEGTAALVTDEDLAWAGKCCTRVIELEAGRVINSYDYGDGSGAATPEQLIPFKVPARKEDRVVFFDPSELLYATSREGKTWLCTDTEEAQTNLTLQELEGRLVGRGFFRAHRAYLVNLQRIKAVIQYTRNSYTLQLDDERETTIPLSKQSEKQMQELLGY